MNQTTSEPGEIADALRARSRFVISSHSRPDGDSIGSQLAMAGALRALGTEVRVVNRDRAPGPLLALPGVEGIEIRDSVDGDFDAAIIMECGDLDRTGVSGLDRYFVINIDHHEGNRAYGQINWFDPSAAACGEMVFTVIENLGVELTPEIATHIYVAILTDTGSFHFSHISPETFGICRRALEAGVDPVDVSRTLFDSHSLGRLKLMAAVLNGMELDPRGRIATLYLDRAIAREAGATYDDTEGLINEPLTVKTIQAVVFFKHLEGDQYRVSMRSKGDVDVRSIAQGFDGGGHTNAAGCTVTGSLGNFRRLFIAHIERAIAIHD
jgi:phosphoesterase RecJ-like protein